MASARSLHRPSLIPPHEEPAHDEGPRPLQLTSANHSVASTPYRVTTLQPFVPHSAGARGEPFTARKAWRGVISGIKALQRLRITGGVAEGPMGKLQSDVVVVSGHDNGNLMVWSADTLEAIGSCTHYNEVNVVQVIVTKTLIYTRVERNMNHGKAGDDDSVFVWNLASMSQKTTLEGHDDRVSALAVPEEDENLAVTGGIDRAICVWDITKPGKPLARLTSHTGTITQLIVSGHLLVSASSDGVVKCWNISTMTEIASVGAVDGHQHINVSLLQWVDPYMTAVRARRAASNPGSNADLSALAISESGAEDAGAMPHGVFVSACQGGTLRYWEVSKKNLVSPWGAKHRTTITDVVWDKDIFVTSSAADNAACFHRRGTSLLTKGQMNTEGTGIRNLAIDRSRKVVIAGSDDGCLCFFSYAELAKSTEMEGVKLLLQIQPHLGAVSNLILERAENAQWERIVSVSNDNTIFCMDFDMNRDAKVYHGAGRGDIVEIDFNGSIVTTAESSVAVWDTSTMTRKNVPRKSLEGHTDQISALTYSKQMRTLVSGSDDGTVRSWNVIEFKIDESASLAKSAAADQDEAYVPAARVTVGNRVTCLSQPVADLVAAGTQKPGSRTGSVAIINLTTGNELLAPLNLHTYPVAVHLLLQPGTTPAPEGAAEWWVEPATVVELSPTKSDEPQTPSPPRAKTEEAPRMFTCVVQLRQGEIMLYAGTVSPTVAAHPIRSIVPQTFDYQLELDATLAPPLPIIVERNPHYDYMYANVTYAESEKRMRCESFVPPPNGKGELRRTPEWGADMRDQITSLVPLGQKGYGYAATDDSGLTRVLSETGAVVLDIEYDGSVNDVQNSMAIGANRRRCYHRPHTMTSREPRFPAAVCAVASPEARCLAIGYRDGTVQVFDIVQRKICRRLCAHGTVVSSLWISSRFPRIMSASVAHDLRFDTLHGRNVTHTGHTNEAALKAAFEAGAGTA